MGAKWLIRNTGSCFNWARRGGQWWDTHCIMWGYQGLWVLPSGENPFPSWIPEMKFFCQHSQ